MTRVYLKGTEKHDESLALYPYVFSVKNYAYFFSKEEWESIPFTNKQPDFNPASQFLQVETYEENNELKNRWIVTNFPPETDIE